MKEKVFLYGKNDRGDWDQMKEFGCWADAGSAVDARRDGTAFAAEGDTTPDAQEFCIATSLPRRNT